MKKERNDYSFKKDNMSYMEMPYFYISSIIKFIYKERKENDGRSSDKVQSDNRKSP